MTKKISISEVMEALKAAGADQNAQRAILRKLPAEFLKNMCEVIRMQDIARMRISPYHVKRDTLDILTRVHASALPPEKLMSNTSERLEWLSKREYLSEWYEYLRANHKVQTTEEVISAVNAAKGQNKIENILMNCTSEVMSEVAKTILGDGFISLSFLPRSNIASSYARDIMRRRAEDGFKAQAFEQKYEKLIKSEYNFQREEYLYLFTQEEILQELRVRDYIFRVREARKTGAEMSLKNALTSEYQKVRTIALNRLLAEAGLKVEGEASEKVEALYDHYTQKRRELQVLPLHYDKASEIVEDNCRKVYDCTSEEEMRKLLNTADTDMLVRMCHRVTAYISKTPTKEECITAFVACVLEHKSNKKAYMEQMLKSQRENLRQALHGMWTLRQPHRRSYRWNAENEYQIECLLKAYRATREILRACYPKERSDATC